MNTETASARFSINALFAGGGEDKARLLGGLLQGSTGNDFLIHHCVGISDAPARAEQVDADIVFLDVPKENDGGSDSFRDVVERLPGVPVAILDPGLDFWFDQANGPDGGTGGPERFGNIPLFHAVRVAVEQKRAKIRLAMLKAALETSTPAPGGAPSAKMPRPMVEGRSEPNRSRMLLEQSERTTQMGSYEEDPETGRFYCSKGMLSVIGLVGEEGFYAREALILAIHPEDRHKVDEARAKLLEKGSHKTEYRVLKPDGTIRHLRLRADVKLDEHGKILKHTGSARDVTEEKWTERALLDSEKRFESLARVSPVGIFETDGAGQCTYVNERWCEIAGLTPDQALGRGWATALHPEDRERVWADWSEATRNQSPFRAEYRFQGRGGRTKWVLGQAVAETDDSGRVIGYAGTTTDITEVKEDEARLRRSEERYRHLFDHAPVAMWEIDYSSLSSWLESLRSKGVEDIVSYVAANLAEVSSLRKSFRPNRVNEAALKLFEAESEDDLPEGLPIPEEPAATRLAQEFLLTMWKGRRHLRSEVYTATLRGRPLDIVVSMNLTAGDLSHTVIAAVDITELKQSRQALETSELRYKELFESAPVAMWETDYSGLASWLERARAAGVTDIRKHFDDSSDEIAEVMGTLHHVAVNKAAVKLFNARSKQELLDNFPGARDSGSPRVLKEVLEVMWDGKTSYEAEIPSFTLDGQEVEIYARWSVPAVDGNSDFTRAIISGTDITARRRAERKVREQERRLRLITDHVPALISYVGADRRYKFVNQRYEDFMGIPVEDIVGRNVADILGENYDDENIEKVLSGQQVSSEYRFIRDGKTLWLQLNFVPDFDDDGTTRGFYALITDLTERKTAEEVLANREEQLRLINDHVPVMISRVDRDRRYQFVNKGYEEFFGLPREEIVGKYVWEIIGRDNYEKHKAKIDLVLEGQQASSEGSIRTVTGQQRWVMVRYVPDTVPDGKEAGFTTMVLDITDRKNAEEQLRTTMARYQHLVDFGPAMIYTAKAYGDFGLTFVSENVEANLGYEAAEFLAVPRFWIDHIHPDDVDRVMGDLPALLETGAHSYEYRFRHKNGSYRVVNDAVQVVLDDEGEPVELVGCWIDVSARHALEERIGQAQKMESVGRLAGGIAHDFNNLLTVVVGYVDLMRERFDGDSTPELDGIDKAVRRATDLTRQLLAFSRRQRLRPVVLDVNGVVEDNLDLLKRLIGEDVELLTKLAPRLLRVRADRIQLVQVFMNLAVNARDAMPDGGLLQIETSNVELDDKKATDLSLSPGLYVRFSVTDTGTGMDVETKAQAFEPFFTTKDQGVGTGLGLSTVLGIVKQSGGSVGIDASAGRGTTVTVYLEGTTEDEAEGAVDSKDVPAYGRNDQTILVVEDDGFVRALTTEILRRKGYRVLEAVDGRAALEIISDNAVDLVLTDIVMPGMRGTELERKLKEEGVDSRVLFMSAYAEDRIDSLAVSPDAAFIAKPFTPDSLVNKVRELLDS